MQNKVMKHFWVYGCLGWCGEVVWTGLGSLWAGDVRLTAKTYLWMLPIYGLAVGMEPIHERIRPWPVWGRGIVWVLVLFGIEYATGWLLRHLVGVSPWDYSGAALNIDGLIRLDYAPLWFVAGLVFEKVHDRLAEKRPA